MKSLYIASSHSFQEQGIEWKEVAGFEGRYLAGTNGQIKSIARTEKIKGGIHRPLKERILKPTLNRGYEYVALAKNATAKNYKVHRLIGKAFIPNPLNKPFINHKNGIKNDNRAVNLEWCDNSENIKHAIDNLGMKPPPKQIGENGNSSKIKESDVRELYELLGNGLSITEIANKKGINRQIFTRIVQGKTWRHLGLNWSAVYDPKYWESQKNKARCRKK